MPFLALGEDTEENSLRSEGDGDWESWRSRAPLRPVVLVVGGTGQSTRNGSFHPQRNYK